MPKAAASIYFCSRKTLGRHDDRPGSFCQIIFSFTISPLVLWWKVLFHVFRGYNLHHAAWTHGNTHSIITYTAVPLIHNTLLTPCTSKCGLGGRRVAHDEPALLLRLMSSLLFLSTLEAHPIIPFHYTAAFKLARILFLRHIEQYAILLHDREHRLKKYR